MASAPSRAYALRAHLRVPMLRDGYALVANEGLTAALGLVYWLIAARQYSPQVVGTNTAAISAMMFIAGVAQLNLMSALLRFIPVFGSARRRFIAACYVVAGAVAVLCAAVFLIFVGLWAPSLKALAANPGMVAWFIAATVAWCVFNLQDSALTGIGAAMVVPVENAVYGAAKIALLIALVSASPHWGVFASWTGALVFSLVPITALIFARSRPQPGDDDKVAEPRPTRSDIVRFAGPDFVGALLWLAATTLMPVIVVGIAGATQNAYFSVAWMISGPLLAISASTGAAFVVAAAGEPGRIAAYARDVLRQTVWMVVPAAIAIALAAPLVLRAFGHAYADHATSTLALLALSAIPNILTTLYVRIYRVQRRMRAVVATLAAQCGLVLVMAPLFLNALGIVGVGLAWVLSQTIVAVALVAVDRRSLWPTVG